MGKMSYREMDDACRADINRTHKKNVIKVMTDKHQPLDQHQGAIGAVQYCLGCQAPNGVLAVRWPCDVVKLLEVTV